MNCPLCGGRAWTCNVKKSGGRRYRCIAQTCGHRFSVGMKSRGRPRMEHRGV